MSEEPVYRTAPATPGLLMTEETNWRETRKASVHKKNLLIVTLCSHSPAYSSNASGSQRSPQSVTQE